ncbi:MAG: PilT/PilU family type 4a pilus ATPase [Firmicutes bacterium]|nr:PilT/PilU family type 4a pilus ATPase [Bacillota bacterium]
MPQLDRLLAQIVIRRGKSLRMDPGAQPMLEMEDGQEVPILPSPVPSTLLDHLVREVLPKDQEAPLMEQGQAIFLYSANDQIFRIIARQGIEGLSMTVEPAQALASAAPSPALVPASAPPKVQPPTPVSVQSELHPMAEKLLSALMERKGSDLHCTSLETPLVRVHGDLKEMEEFPILGPKELREIMKSIAPPLAWEHYETRNDADFAYAYERGHCRLRVNFFADRQGPGMVCRVIPSEIPDPHKLGLPEPIQRLADLPKGLVLVTGPTGSGKSTTLAAILDLANRHRHDHILTIEDPIEFVHPRKGCLVNQREVGTHTESFKTGLRAALREDPDIVLVGEMRDLETISIALETAVTGHLVFGTLHTSSAVGTVDRIVDQFPADRQQQIRVMLADACKAVICQTLLKRKGGGRVAAMESLFITPAIANLIREGKNFQIPSAMQTGRAYGQKLMTDALVELVQTEIVEPSEAYAKCSDREALMAGFKRVGITWDLRHEERPVLL